ncbi:MAG: TetR/AcrR family transcriptional regulator [Sulfitobacter sp.]
MTKASDTRDRLLAEGRRLIWGQGYSNVSLRQIAGAAGVDVALISRYFGSKMGLFEATLETAFDLPPTADAKALEDLIVQLFMQAPRGGPNPSSLQLLVMNAKDPEIGETLRRAHADKMQNGLAALLGSDTRAALLMAVLLGFSLAEKSLHLPGIAHHQSGEYEAQLRHLITAALTFGA